MEAKLNIVDGKLHGEQFIYQPNGTISRIVFYNDGRPIRIIFFEKNEEITIDMVAMTCLKKWGNFSLYTKINDTHRTNGEWRLQWKNKDISLSGFRRDGKYSKDGWIFTVKGVQHSVEFDIDKNAWISNEFLIDETTFAISEIDMTTMILREDLDDFIIVVQIDEERRPNGEWRLQWKTGGTSLYGSKRDGEYSKDGWIFTLKGVEYSVVFDSKKNEWIGNEFAIDEKTFAIFELLYSL